MTNDTNDMMFEVSRGVKSLNISFSAALENIDRASEETRRFLAAAGLEGRAFDIILVMREALNNAVRHGSCNDCNMTVTYRLQLKENDVVMEIEDGGKGFDWQACLEKELDLTSDCGLGLEIMKKYSTDIRYNEKGNRLVCICSKFV